MTTFGRPHRGAGRSAFAYALALAASLAGCTVGPDYARPELKLPERFEEGRAVGVSVSPIDAATAWWESLRDPKLTELIGRARENNLDLAEARARVREARAARTAAGADLFPQLGLQGAYQRTRRSENATPPPQADGQARARLLSGLTRNLGSPPAASAGALTRELLSAAVNEGVQRRNALRTPRASVEQDLYQVGLDMNWEIDVFGGTRRAVEAAEADIVAAEAGYDDVLVSLLSEVALNYVELRSAQRRLEIAAQNIASQRESVELARSRYEAGLTSELDVAQAEAQLATTMSQVPSLEIDAVQAIHRLSYLLGQPPKALAGELLAAGPIPPTPPVVPVGLPSDLVRRRPDIRRAERELAASTARVGEAIADLFPRFSLTGAFGMQTYDFATILDWRSRVFSIGPTVRWPVFDGARIRANIAVQDARQEQALTRYERTVLLALAEVESALVSYERQRARYETLRQAVAADRRAVEISTELYSRGLTSFLNVLESQRALFQAEDQLVQSEQAAVTSLIALYKALGGGWAASDVGSPTTLPADRYVLLNVPGAESWLPAAPTLPEPQRPTTQPAPAAPPSDD
ncbi:MAG: efflux transporter outer membrane subunit [Phycisphaerales bacterium]|nr:efflux transporter outer membrane subunit [Phycisphaerales bacterium]